MDVAGLEVRAGVDEASGTADQLFKSFVVATAAGGDEGGVVRGYGRTRTRTGSRNRSRSRAGGGRSHSHARLRRRRVCHASLAPDIYWSNAKSRRRARRRCLKMAWRSRTGGKTAVGIVAETRLLSASKAPAAPTAGQ